MYKLLRIAVFAAPLVGGVAWAQSSGSANVPGGTAVDDTRTTEQRKAEDKTLLPSDDTMDRAKTKASDASDEADAKATRGEHKLRHEDKKIRHKVKSDSTMPQRRSDENNFDK